MSFIYSNIKREAKEQKMSLKSLAEQIGMTDAGFHQMVNNDSMKLSTFLQIADVLKVDPQILMMKDFIKYLDNDATTSVVNEDGATLQKQSAIQMDVDYFAARIEQLKKEIEVKDKLIAEQKALLDKFDNPIIK